MLKVRSPNAGFTLLELILVMGVIFLFAAVVAPNFSGFVPALRVRRGGEELMAAGRQARADAALKGRIVRLNLDSENNEFWLTIQGDPFEDPEEFLPLTGPWSGNIPLPDDVSFESTEGIEEDPYYEFRPDGSATDGSITVSNQKEDRLTIQIDGSTGRVYVDDEEEE